MHRMTLAFLSAAFLAGVYLADKVEVSRAAVALLLLASVLSAVLLFRLRRSPLPALVVAALLLGGLRLLSAGGVEGGPLAVYHDQSVRVRGDIVSDPESSGTAASFRFRVDQVDPGDGWTLLDPGPETLLVTARESVDLATTRDAPYFRYGDTLLLTGRVTAPPRLEDFDYARYLARQGIGSVMAFPDVSLAAEGGGDPFHRWLYGLRRTLARSLASVVPEPQAAVGQALLLGVRDGLPDDLVEDFRVSGTAHVLAVSGMHVGVLMALGLALSRAVLGNQRRHLLAPLMLVWLYALLTGASPSVLRAAIMATVYLAAVYLGRPRSALPALALAAAVMVAVATGTLWSISFQLSFAAVAGIAVLSPVISDWLKGRASAARAPSQVAPLLDILAVSLAATAATLPLIAFYFERVSVVGLFSTILMLPALPFVLVGHALAAAVGTAGTAVGLPFGLLAWAPTAYVTGIAGLTAGIPGAAVETGPVAPAGLAAYYLLLALAFLALRRAARRADREAEGFPSSPSRPGVSGRLRAAVILASAAVLLWTAALARSDPALRVTFIDVGQGDSILVSAPGRNQVLIDGGGDPVGLLRALGERMPLGDRTIELVVLTHAHSDHVNGLTEVLRRYDVERILERRVDFDSAPYAGWRQAVATEGARVVAAQAGQTVRFSDDIFADVLGPPETLLQGTRSDVDNASVVLRFRHGDVSFLLTGDIYAESERRILDSGVPVGSTVLKAGHHGSRAASSDDFLAGVAPVAVVVSAGEDNRYGHPHAETIDKLRRSVGPDMVFVTKDRGTVEFVSDGRRLWVTTER